MKKIFESEYSDHRLMKEITDWIESKTIGKNWEPKVIDLKIVVEIYDQNGELLNED